MTEPRHLNRSRAASYRRAWIGFGAALLVCSTFFYWVVSDEGSTRAAAIHAARSAHPDMTICFAPDPLQDIRFWISGINIVAALGIMVRGLMIRLPTT